MKDLGILSLKLFFFIVASLREVKVGVCNFICLALMIVNPKMVSRKLLGLLDLTRAQAFHIHKPTKVVIVG